MRASTVPELIMQCENSHTSESLIPKSLIPESGVRGSKSRVQTPDSGLRTQYIVLDTKSGVRSAECRVWSVGFSLSLEYKPWTPDSRLRTPYSRLRTLHSRLRTPDFVFSGLRTPGFGVRGLYSRLGPQNSIHSV